MAEHDRVEVRQPHSQRPSIQLQRAFLTGVKQNPRPVGLDQQGKTMLGLQTRICGAIVAKHRDSQVVRHRPQLKSEQLRTAHAFKATARSRPQSCLHFILDVSYIY
ncbi:MAG: hypothetical protein ACPL7M_04670 [Bryobacteraceae bacterium]